VYADVIQAAAGRCAASETEEPNSAHPLMSGDQVLDNRQPSGDVNDPSGNSLAGRGTYTVCAWLHPSWPGASSSQTIAGPVSATITALAPTVYNGETSQRLPISIMVAPAKRQVTAIAYQDRLSCARRVYSTSNPSEYWNGLWTFATSQYVFPIGGDGRFSVRLVGSVVPQKINLRGRLSGGSISGTLAESGRSDAFVTTNERVSCHTGTVSFTARPSGASRPKPGKPKHKSKPKGRPRKKHR
jgi:hypothetical protein